MDETTTHVAGFRITICGRTIQRCSICGEKLVDSLGMMAPLNPDGTPPQIGTFEPGRMVRVSHDGQGCGRMLLLPDTENLPKDSCLDLVE